MSSSIGNIRFFIGKRISLFVVILLLLSSCKQQEKIVIAKGKCILDYKNAKTLTANLKANEFHFDRLNAKLTIESTIDSSSNTFTVSLKIKKDSVIWMSISKLGIEGARVLITKDSVKLVNRLNSKYFIGDFSYISKLLNTDMDFEILQSLLVGNSVSFYDEENKVKPGADNCQYTLGTIRKHKLRKVIKGKELKEPVQSIYLIPKLFKISRILLYEFNPDRSLEVQYGDFANIDSTQLFPLKMNLTFKSQKDITFDITYNKPTFVSEQTFLFKIPSDYEQIIFNEKK